MISLTTAEMEAMKRKLNAKENIVNALNLSSAATMENAFHQGDIRICDNFLSFLKLNFELFKMQMAV